MPQTTPLEKVPYLFGKGNQPFGKRCLTFSDKVANLLGQGVLPFPTRCLTFPDQTGHPACQNN